MKNCLMQICLSRTGVVIFGEKVSLVYVIDSVCFWFFAKTRTRRQIFGKERLKKYSKFKFWYFLEWQACHSSVIVFCLISSIYHGQRSVYFKTDKSTPYFASFLLVIWSHTLLKSFIQMVFHYIKILSKYKIRCQGLFLKWQIKVNHNKWLAVTDKISIMWIHFMMK